MLIIEYLATLVLTTKMKALFSPKKIRLDTAIISQEDSNIYLMLCLTYIYVSGSDF